MEKISATKNNNVARIRRLERQEIIEVTKKDMQNLIKLRYDFEEENEQDVTSFPSVAYLQHVLLVM